LDGSAHFEKEKEHKYIDKYQRTSSNFEQDMKTWWSMRQDATAPAGHPKISRHIISNPSESTTLFEAFEAHGGALGSGSACENQL
jgi:hypothetical protein